MTERRGVNSSKGIWVFSVDFIIHALPAFLFNFHSLQESNSKFTAFFDNSQCLREYKHS